MRLLGETSISQDSMSNVTYVHVSMPFPTISCIEILQTDL